MATVGWAGGSANRGTTGSLRGPLAHPGGELGAVLEPGLGKGVADVVLDRPHRELELGGDLLVRETLGDEARHLRLALAQASPPGRSRLPGTERQRCGFVDR